MSLEELERGGVLLPRQEWGTRDLNTQVAKAPLILLGALVPVSSALMYLGDGGWPTWLGLGIYLVQLAAFTRLSLRGIR